MIYMIKGEDVNGVDSPRNLRVAIRHGRGGGVATRLALVTTSRYMITSHSQTSHCDPVTSADSVRLHDEG
jgi:hypothetical protein